MNRIAAIMILVFTISISLCFIECASFKEHIGLNRTVEHSSQFTIEKMVIAESIKNREPVGVSDTFPPTTEKVYCFLEVTNIAQDTQIKFIWYRNSKRVHTYKLPLKQGVRWRTYAYKNIYGKKGKWNVEVKDSKGNIVKAVAFKVQ